ncbi:hypothetical protein B0H14DRAFT_3120181 [Mycena olivaceomarginata]|nr:hypothetical protein B0H14DRAFT_3120181 [Mycena olivaceomarginata]
MRLTKLNDTRLLAGKISELDLHKQLMMAIATSNEHRISSLIRAGLNNGESIDAMLNRFYRAYDYMVGLCVLRLGGARLADLLHRALGLPGLTTLQKHSVIRSLRASVAMPKVAEIEANIDAYTAAENTLTGPPRIVHQVLMLDEIAVEKRARWDDKTSMILGACREHSQNAALEFCHLNDTTTNQVHLASEPQMYNPRLDPEHAAINNPSVASDSEAKRGLALALEFMKYVLTPSSPIYPLLHPLEFMNLLVGPDDITPDKHYRHVFKALRSLLMHRMGVNVLCFEIVPAVLKQHLRDMGLTDERIHALLNPNDHQDVDLTYSLLKEVWCLPDAPPTSIPTYIRGRTALQIFGQLAYHLLSLREQLTHLSTAAHLLLVLFTTDGAGTNFMANQTFNAFFCVAKAKIDIPDSEFFLILLGTDRLEKLFGLIRTAFASRASNLTEVNIILGLKPHWDRGPPDHVSPASWIGDVHVADVVPHTCWIAGSLKVEKLIATAQEQLQRRGLNPKFDILSPFGELLVGRVDSAA